MATKETAKSKNEPKPGSEVSGSKILTGALYLATTFFVLGFLWQSIGSFMFPE